jgi:rusticyanin
MMNRKQMSLLAVAVLALAGAGTAMAVAAASSPAPVAPAASAPAGPGYSWYRSMMGRNFGGGTMMGGTPYRWMMGASGYRWMMGGTRAPAWMRGAALPGPMTGMMGTSADPGRIMGRLWASAPGPRVSPAEAARLGRQAPAGARVDRAAGTITFITASVRVVAVASPAGGPDETFRIAGLVNPVLSVPAGAPVRIEVINADPGTAHGLVITAPGTGSAWMPMMTDRPAFAGAALWFLGSPSPAGMHSGTLAFTAATPGTYRYLCPVPGHVQLGMTGTFTVRVAH